MSKLEIKQKRRIRFLEEALQPFADVPVTEAGDVWFYVGKADPKYPAHLHTVDFLTAKEAVNRNRRSLADF